MHAVLVMKLQARELHELINRSQCRHARIALLKGREDKQKLREHPRLRLALRQKLAQKFRDETAVGHGREVFAEFL